MINPPQELNETALAIVGGLTLVLGGSLVLLQVPAIREAFRTALQDSAVHNACREAVTRVGHAFIDSWLRQIDTVTLPAPV